MVRIRSVTLNHFRGVPGQTSVEFCRPKTKEPSSVIIFGDNGTGKSSIVDASPVEPSNTTNPGSPSATRSYRSCSHPLSSSRP
ncbi:AAA family ATPase [Bremerella sp.]|uniref:AAA family ATPase n=1 Tax=Bremerella sp. TaxID=2795602 RepID=UPI00391A50B1